MLSLIFAVTGPILCLAANPFFCPTGYYQDPSNATNCLNCTNVMPGCVACLNSSFCLNCEAGYILTTAGQCTTLANTTCPTGFYKDPVALYCVSCSASNYACLECSGSDNCTLCSNSTTLFNGTCIPREAGACTEGSYWNVTALSCLNCSDAIPGCAACLNSTLCTSCLSGYLLVNETCLTPENFTCQAGFYADPTQNFACIMCSDAMPDCGECMNATVCLSCVDGYALVNNTCIVACPYGYYADPTNGTCLNCSDAISDCDFCTNSTTCLVCGDDYTLMDGTCFLSEGMACAPGSYFDLNASSCLNCSAVLQGCTQCTNASFCLVCDVGYYEMQGQCFTDQSVTCPPGTYMDLYVPGCINCTDVLANCTSCLNSTSLTQSSYCTNCTANTTLVNGTCIPVAELSCGPGTYQDAYTLACIDCDMSMPNCTACLNSTYCFNCSVGYMPLNGSCVLETGGICPLGSYPDPVTGNCSFCSALLPNCTACTNGTFCTACLPGNTLLNENCVYTETGVCQDGMYLDPFTGNCSICSAAISWCGECVNASVCISCMPSAVFVDGVCVHISTDCSQSQFRDPQTNACVNCSNALPNCTGCNNATTCLICASGNTLINGVCLTGGASVGCPAGTYNDSTTLTCISCSSVMPNCTACLNATVCTGCAAGSILTNGTCIFSEAYVCPFGAYKDKVSGACVNCTAAIPNCRQCSNATLCTECVPGTLPVGKLCLPLVPSNCTVGKYLDPSTQICLNCADVLANCTACDNATFCINCTDGNLPVNGICVPASKVGCLGGLYRDPISLQCVNCSSALSNCIDCVNSSTCLNCSGGYVVVSGKCMIPGSRRLRRQLQDGGAVGSNCSVANCTRCSRNASMCTKCSDGFYLKNGECYNCSDGCSSCIYALNLTLCQSCEAGYYKVNGTCVPCAEQLANCTRCSRTGICMDCSYGYYKNSTGNCTDCSQTLPGCRYCLNETYCARCIWPYKLNVTTHQCQCYLPHCDQCAANGRSCLSCMSGYYIKTKGDNSWCLPCHPQCSACQGSGSKMCTVCPGNSTLVLTAGQSNVGSCKCNAGYVFSGKVRACV